MFRGIRNSSYSSQTPSLPLYRRGGDDDDLPHTSVPTALYSILMVSLMTGPMDQYTLTIQHHHLHEHCMYPAGAGQNGHWEYWFGM